MASAIFYNTTLTVDWRPTNEFGRLLTFNVLIFHRRLGILLLAVAVGVGLDRIFVGVHYPIDVLTSVFVGLAAALVVTLPGRPYVVWPVRIASRVTDPVVLAVRRRAGR